MSENLSDYETWVTYYFPKNVNLIGAKEWVAEQCEKRLADYENPFHEVYFSRFRVVLRFVAEGHRWSYQVLRRKKHETSP